MNNGVLILDKPKGMTSFKVVEVVKKRLKAKKVGHTGTLDPMATGLLTLCVGRATKIAQFLTDADKVYQGSITLGIETDSYDMEGTIIEERKVPEGLTLERLNKLAKEFLGKIPQVPPVYSAAKHKGVPLYKLARRGIRIKKEPKIVEIYDFNILKYEPPVLEFIVHCSKGTYIRSLAHDFGKRLGCGGTLSDLRRIRSGFLSVNNAISLDKLMEKGPEEIKGKMMPVELVLSHIPGILINNKDAISIAKGRGLSLVKVLGYMQEQLPDFSKVESKYLRLMVRNRSDRVDLVCIARWPRFDNPNEQLEILRVWNPN